MQQARLSDGRRVVASVAEVTGVESGRIQMQELFRYERAGGFSACGILPSFVQAWQEAEVDLDVAWFGTDRAASGAAYRATLP